ncbi:MAG: SDR family oxidoreductase [Flavobacteriaceae bacterium]|jgi:short-subunit dehydrogenase|nr:SDR family oxidoreductase [Flavobacteriaceae bacterium]MBT6447117.1 SDR family oxidoreductase [Flavobacteriaceae bacterium]
MKIFLTGSSGGIGQAIERKLKNNGVEVINPSSSELDLASNISIDKIKVDGFIHCAGINEPKSYKVLNKNSFYRLFQINTYSFIEITKNLIFSKHSNIIAIGSLYSTLAKENRIEYSMSKHALHAAVKTLAIEMAKDKVLVNLISPGFVDTPLTRKNLSNSEILSLEKKIPLGFTSADQIADMIYYLISNNKSISGQNIIIDNGYSLI